MNPDTLQIKHKLSQLVGRLVATCESALAEHRVLGERHGFPSDVPLQFIAAEEAESVIRSFAASDRRVLAEELLPGYEALGPYLPHYADNVERVVAQHVENPDQFKKDDRWKYSPSELLHWLIHADSRGSTDFSLDYAELLLDIADIVCRLDGHVSTNEQFDIREFANTLDQALQKNAIAEDGDLDLSSRRWKRRRVGEKQSHESADSADIDDLLHVLLTPRTTSATASDKGKQEAPCVGCAKVGSFATHYCETCSEPVAVVALESQYIEIEESLDDGVQIGGPCGCGAAFLHSRRSASRAWLDCHHCGGQYRIRLIPRHRLLET